MSSAPVSMSGSPVSDPGPIIQTEALNAALAGPQHGKHRTACGFTTFGAASARPESATCAAGLAIRLKPGG